MAPGRWHCPCFRPESDDITVLEYSHFNLEDVPSEVFSFERTLEELYLDANQIKDLPRPLFHCHGLRKLILSDNEIQSLPPAIASLINLEELDISKNGILEIPDNINGCKRLSCIEASVNPLGRLPEGFTQLINLEELYLNDTFLEYLPANFGRLCHLRILELRENHLKVLPKSMTRLTELTRLDIGQNDFVELPEVIGALSKLVELWCDGNRILKIPPCLGNLKKLVYLDASKNKIQEVAAEMDGCSFMTDLTLSNNKLKHLPHTIGNLKKLAVLHIENNQLVSIPPSLGNLQCLEELVMSSNNVHILPASFGLLRNLHTFLADDNSIEALPREIGSCSSLSILSLRNNRLCFVPDELGHIARLRVINLVSNHLSNLPFSIAKLPNLHALWLSENQAKPLIPLQSDVDPETGQRVLTCFMLPQSPLDQSGGVEPTTPDSEAEREGRQQIKFSSDVEMECPGKLVRAPTPYPKELKAHARHARNFVLKKLDANGTYTQYPVQDNSPLEELKSELIAQDDARILNSRQHENGPYHSVRRPVVEFAPTDAPSEDHYYDNQRGRNPEQPGGRWEESSLDTFGNEDALVRLEKSFMQDCNPSPSHISKPTKKQISDGIPGVHQSIESGGNYSPDGRKYYCHPTYNSGVQLGNAVPTSTNSFVQRAPKFSSPTTQNAQLSFAHKVTTLPPVSGPYPPQRLSPNNSQPTDPKQRTVCLEADRQSPASDSGHHKVFQGISSMHQPGRSNTLSHRSSPIGPPLTLSKQYSYEAEMACRPSDLNQRTKLSTYSGIAWYTGSNLPSQEVLKEGTQNEMECKRQSYTDSLPSPSSSDPYRNMGRHGEFATPGGQPPNNSLQNGGDRNSWSYRNSENGKFISQ